MTDDEYEGFCKGLKIIAYAETSHCPEPNEPLSDDAGINLVIDHHEIELPRQKHYSLQEMLLAAAMEAASTYSTLSPDHDSVPGHGVRLVAAAVRREADRLVALASFRDNCQDDHVLCAALENAYQQYEKLDSLSE